MPDRILLFRPDHIGDLLLTTPALYALRQTCPDAHISICVGAWSAPLLKGNPDPNEIIICNLPWLHRGPNRSWPALLPVVRRIRAGQFDHVLNFRIAAKAAAFSCLLGGRTRWGFDVKKSRWAWHHTAPYDRNQHVVDNYLELTRTFLKSHHPGAVPNDPARFRVFPETEDLAPVADLLKEGPPAVVLGITSGHPDKAWRPDRWAVVADHLANRGFRVLLNGAPSEKTDIQAVQIHQKHPSESLVGRFSLLQFAGLLKQCAAIITIDSFPMHLAAAVGLPVVALFGATSSTMWGPYPGTQPTIVVEPPPEIPRDARAMGWIEPQQVIDAFERLNLRP